MRKFLGRGRRAAIAVLAALTLASAAPSTGMAQQSIPTAEQRENISRLVKYYFGMLDTGEYAKAHAVFFPSVRARMKLADFEKLQKSQAGEFGKPTQRTIAAYDWRLGATRVGTGTAIFVRFSGVFEKGHMFCGHLIVLELEEADFKIFKDDKSLFTDDEMKASPENVRREILNRPGCRQFLTAFEGAK